MQVIQKSLYQIQAEHLNLLTLIEDADGELTEEIEQLLQLTNEDFENKAVSYGYIVKRFDDTSDLIDKEIKRLQDLKKKADKRAQLFKQRLDEAMRQFKIEKITTPTLTLSYRKSSCTELDETLKDSILKYVDVKVELSTEKIEAAKKEVPEGESYDPIIDVLGDAVKCLKTSVELSKSSFGEVLKQGVKIPGAKIEEKKNLQIK